MMQLLVGLGDYLKILNMKKGYKIKKLLVLPGEKISLQKHLKRSEHWVVIDRDCNNN